MFSTMGVIETVKKLRWQPAVIHCSGWVSALAPLYLRRKYNDDPTFRNSKIVFALHPDKFEGTLDPRFVEKLIMSEFTEDDLRIFGNEPVDFKKLNKLAMEYADAIIQVTDDVDPELVEYAASTSKPFLPYDASEPRSAQYVNFYRTLTEE